MKKPFCAALALVAACATSSLVPARAAADQVIHVLYAGSLITPFEKQVVPALAAHGYMVDGEARGSVANANLMRAGLKRPDVFISADTSVAEKL